MKLLARFFKRFLHYKRDLALGFLAIPLAQFADVWITILIGDAIKRARTAPDAEWLPRVIGLLVIFTIGHSIFRFLQRWLLVVVSRRVEIDLKQQLFDKLTSLSFDFHNRSRSGDVVSRLTSDVENLRMFLGPGLMYTLGAGVVVPFSLFVLYQLNSTLALTMIAPMLAMGLIMKALSPRLHRHSMAVQESLAEIAHRAQENFGGIRVVKGYSREETQGERFAKSSSSNRDNQIELGRARGWTHAAINGSFDLTFATILLIGGLAAVDRTLPVGDLFKFIDLTIKVFWPLIALGWIAGMYPRAVASAKRVDQLLSEEPSIHDPEDAKVLEQVRGELRFEDVSYRYAPDLPLAVSGINVHIPAGKSLGIVGPTGSGKTTLLNLIGRLFEPEGKLSLDGVPVGELSLSSLRGSLSYVPQDSFLFSAPYEDNIRFGADEDISDERVDELIARAAMTDEVANFPDGKRQLVGERGVTLSGGQRQRTCIARALARNPRVLLLDDCLSAVDTETESHLLASLGQEGQGRTLVLSAHRLSSVAGADQILVLDRDGSQLDIGTHEQLLKSSDWYSETWYQQQRKSALVEGR